MEHDIVLDVCRPVLRRDDVGQLRRADLRKSRRRQGGCGVPEVGPRSLTSGDRGRTWSPRVAAVTVLDLPAGARTAPT